MSSVSGMVGCCLMLFGCQFATGLNELHIEQGADDGGAHAGGTGGTGGDGAGAIGGGGGAPPTSSMTSSGGGEGVGGAGGTSSCGADEAGNVVAAAEDLGGVTDCDRTGGTITGILDAPSDEDWFVYVGGDAQFCDTDPGVAAGNADVALCEYFDCLDASAPTFSCPGGTTPSTAMNGATGCCGSTGAAFLVGDVACPSGDIRVWLRLMTGASSGCVNYSMTWHF